MKALYAYLNFNGNTVEAFNFYKSVFGGEFTSMQRFKDMPGSEKMPAGDQEKIMHIALPIAPGTILMASDVIESMGQKLKEGNNFHLTINPDNEAEALKLFNGLAAGGKVNMPLEKTFWGAYFGMLTDKFGIQWMVNYVYPKEK